MKTTTCKNEHIDTLFKPKTTFFKFRRPFYASTGHNTQAKTKPCKKIPRDSSETTLFVIHRPLYANQEKDMLCASEPHLVRISKTTSSDCVPHSSSEDQTIQTRTLYSSEDHFVKVSKDSFTQVKTTSFTSRPYHISNQVKSRSCKTHCVHVTTTMCKFQ